MKINYNDKEYEYEIGTTLLKISEDFKSNYKFDIILGKINNDVCELDRKVLNDCKVDFYDLTNHIANKVYENGLIFLLVGAIKELFNSDIKIAHSIDKGIYCEILGDKKISESDIKSIKEKINEYVNAKIPFSKYSVSRLDAMEYYEKNNQKDKSDILRYVLKSSLLIYKFNNCFDYFYGDMPIDSSYIKYFDLVYLDEKSMVLLTPNIYINGEIKSYEHYEKIFNAFKDFSNWGKTQSINCISDLNEVIASNKINNLIYMNESHCNKALFDVSDIILKNKDLKIILIAGPSSSGKTTTAKKLGFYLNSMGIKPKSISIDDYFLERADTPKDENGNYDFESINSIDTNLFNTNLNKLLNNEEIDAPTYNFVTGKKEYNRKMKLLDHEILIIEGLHALDEKITELISSDKKFKIYISPLTCLNIDNHNRISTSDLRLLRRIVRDNMNRGYNATETLTSWRSVRSGEEKYVFPFQNKSDIVINSSLIYELGILRTYVEPLLFSVKQTDANYNEAVRLISLIRNVLPISGIELPYDSILREFIGNSLFSKMGDE